MPISDVDAKVGRTDEHRSPGDLSPDVRSELMETVRALVRDKVAPRAAAIDIEKLFPEDIRRYFAAAGLLGLCVPERFGGVGAPLEWLVEVVMEVASTCANSANIITQQALAMAPLLIGGSEEQATRWLPAMAAGEMLGSFALTEPDAGSDNKSMTARADRHGDHYIVNGTKVFCTWGSIASIVTIFAQARGDEDGTGIVALVLELPADGFTVARLEEKMGLNGSPTAQIILSDVRIPVANRLGRPGDGLRIALSSLNAGRVEVGAASLGIAKGALDYAGRYLLSRHQFGKPLASFQGLQFRVADHVAAIAAARLLLVDAARAVDSGSGDQIQLSAMAKLVSTDVAMQVTSDAVNLLGGYGYLKDFPVERMMRDAKVNQIVEGTNEIQRIVIAREWFRGLGTSSA